MLRVKTETKLSIKINNNEKDQVEIFKHLEVHIYSNGTQETEIFIRIENASKLFDS